MSSKNNPENRGQVTELRKYNGKKVKPVFYIGPAKGGKKSRYMAAMFEDGNLVMCPVGKYPLAYQDI